MTPKPVEIEINIYMGHPYVYGGNISNQCLRFLRAYEEIPQTLLFFFVNANMILKHRRMFEMCAIFQD